MFDPHVDGTYAGILEFQGGVPDGGLQQEGIALFGTAFIDLHDCFIVRPRDLNFGVVGLSDGQYCARGKRAFTAGNGCPFDVTIESASISPADTPWILIGPTLPIIVGQGASSPRFDIGFGPITQPGAYLATMTLSVQGESQNAEEGIYLETTVPTPPTWTDRFTGSALFLSRQFPLSGTPVVSSLVVSLNAAQLAANDWSYNDIANTIVLGDAVVLEKSDVLSVSYWPECS
jgi:hypothetical protein